MSTKRQKNIEDKLEDLGFDSIADSLRFDSKHAVESYFSIDLNRLRRETTEEEFPTSVYNQVSRLIKEWFSIQKTRTIPAVKRTISTFHTQKTVKKKRNPKKKTPFSWSKLTQKQKCKIIDEFSNEASLFYSPFEDGVYYPTYPTGRGKPLTLENIRKMTPAFFKSKFFKTSWPLEVVVEHSWDKYVMEMFGEYLDSKNYRITNFNPKSRNSKMAIKRKNPTYKRKKAKNGRFMYFKDGKPITKAKFDRATKKGTLVRKLRSARKKNPQYTRKRNKAGIMMHRKDGILISKEEFDRAVKSKGRIVKSSKDVAGLVAKTAEAKKILKKKSMTKADKSAVRRTVVLLEQAALGSKAKANPKKSTRKANSNAKKAMKLYHFGKVKSLKAAWRMVKR